MTTIGMDLDEYEQLSSQAKDFYEQHRDFYDKLADEINEKHDGFVSMVGIIEADCKKGKPTVR